MSRYRPRSPRPLRDAPWQPWIVRGRAPRAPRPHGSATGSARCGVPMPSPRHEPAPPPRLRRPHRATGRCPGGLQVGYIWSCQGSLRVGSAPRRVRRLPPPTLRHRSSTPASRTWACWKTNDSLLARRCSGPRSRHSAARSSSPRAVAARDRCPRVQALRKGNRASTRVSAVSRWRRAASSSPETDTSRPGRPRTSRWTSGS